MLPHQMGPGPGTSGARMPTADKQMMDRYMLMQRQRIAELQRSANASASQQARMMPPTQSGSGGSTSDRQAHITQLANHLRMQAQSYMQQQLMTGNGGGPIQPTSPVVRHPPAAPGLSTAALAQLHRRQREHAALAQRTQAAAAAAAAQGHHQPSSSSQLPMLIQHLPEHLRPERMETARLAAVNMQRQFTGRADAISSACQELIELRDSLQNQLAAMKILMISEVSRLFDCLSAAVVSETEDQLLPSKKLLKELREKSERANKVSSCAAQIQVHYGKIGNHQLETIITQTIAQLNELEQAEPLLKAAMKDVIRLGKFDVQIDLSPFDSLFDHIKKTAFGFFSVKNDEDAKKKKFERIGIPECVPRLKLWDQLSTKKLTLRNQGLQVKRPYNDAQRGLLRMMFACFMRWFDTPNLPGTAGVDETPTIFWQNPLETPRTAPPKQIDLTGEGLGGHPSTPNPSSSSIIANNQRLNHTATPDSARPSTSRLSEDQEQSQSSILEQLREAVEEHGTQEPTSSTQPIDFSAIQEEEERGEPVAGRETEENNCERMETNGDTNHLHPHTNSEYPQTNGSHSPGFVLHEPDDEAERREEQVPSTATPQKHNENGLRVEVAKDLGSLRKCPSPASSLPPRPSMVGQPPGRKLNSPLRNSPTPPRAQQVFNRPPPPRNRRQDQSPGGSSSIPSIPSGSQSPALSDGSANAWNMIAKTSKEIKKTHREGREKRPKKRKAEEKLVPETPNEWELPDEWQLDEDGHHNMCYTCFNRKEHDEDPGMCDSCPRIYHSDCHIPKVKCTMAELPDDWKCSYCLPSTPTTSINKEFSGDDRLNCCKVLLACFMKPYYSSLFIDPVDLNIEREYKKLVEKPMDFGTIAALLEEVPRESIDSERLGNAADFINHMNTIFMNCSIYNESGTVAMDACKAVYNDYVAAVKKYLPAYKHKVFFFIHFHKATKKHSIRWRPIEGQLGEPFYDEMDYAPHVIPVVQGSTSPIRMKIKLPRPISESDDEIHEPSMKKHKKHKDRPPQPMP